VQLTQLARQVGHSERVAKALWRAVAHEREGKEQHRVERLEIVDGLLRAFGIAQEILAVSLSSESRADALNVLVAPPYSFSETQAQHVLDLTLGGFTAKRLSVLQQEADALRRP
jgi:DNA gyrase/topoisomerase IV subunit A